MTVIKALFALMLMVCLAGCSVGVHTKYFRAGVGCGPSQAPGHNVRVQVE